MPVAIDTEDNFYFWGNTRLRQDQYESNSELNMALRRGDLEIKQLEAGNQFSIILDTAGNVYLWGNPSGNELDCRDKERIEEGEDKEPVSTRAILRRLPLRTTPISRC